MLIFIGARVYKIIPTYLNPLQYRHSLAQGIDFTRLGTPTFIESIQGFAGVEPWGRWTDATSFPTAKIKFKVSLPRSFSLIINAHAYGPNTKDPIIIRLVSNDPASTHLQERKVYLNSSPTEFKLDFSIKDTPNVDTIEIVPPHPIAPNKLNPKSDDYRLIGIGINSIKIINTPKK